MAIWGEIRKSLNSTLGTANFKPLDKMLSEQFRMEASDNFYASVWEEKIVAETTQSGEVSEIEVPTKIKMINSGTAYLKGDYYNSWRSSLTGYLYVYKNGEQVVSIGGRWGEVETNIAFSEKISFEINDVFSFKIYARNVGDYDRKATCQISNVSLSGDIVPNVFVKI